MRSAGLSNDKSTPVMSAGLPSHLWYGLHLEVFHSSKLQVFQRHIVDTLLVRRSGNTNAARMQQR